MLQSGFPMSVVLVQVQWLCCLREFFGHLRVYKTWSLRTSDAIDTWQLPKLHMEDHVNDKGLKGVLSHIHNKWISLLWWAKWVLGFEDVDPSPIEEMASPFFIRAKVTHVALLAWPQRLHKGNMAREDLLYASCTTDTITTPLAYWLGWFVVCAPFFVQFAVHER
jgi:hypothetical protein